MSFYTNQRCVWRAEAAGAGDWDRIIREHEEAAKASDLETARIARGFALIARRRRDEERWRSDAYVRLSQGKDITVRDEPVYTATQMLVGLSTPIVDRHATPKRGRTKALTDEIARLRRALEKQLLYETTFSNEPDDPSVYSEGWSCVECVATGAPEQYAETREQVTHVAGCPLAEDRCTPHPPTEEGSTEK